MAQRAQNRRPDILQKMLWNLIYADKSSLFVEKMLITPSTFYRWLNGTRYPSVENIRRINRVMKTKKFLGLDYNLLPE
jgi:predicted transcriptional regulator